MADWLAGAMETAVPAMWAICGGLIYAAWNRIDEKSGQENVDKVRIPPRLLRAPSTHAHIEKV